MNNKLIILQLLYEMVDVIRQNCHFTTQNCFCKSVKTILHEMVMSYVLSQHNCVATFTDGSFTQREF